MKLTDKFTKCRERSALFFRTIEQFHVEYITLIKTNPTRAEIDSFLHKRQNAISSFLKN